MVLLGGHTSVGQFIPENPWYLQFSSRSLIKPTLSEGKLWYMHHTYGASLSDLFIFADDPDLYERLVISEIRKLSIDELAHLYLFTDTTDDGCYLMSIGPSPTNRAKPEMKFSSPSIFEECCTRILKGSIARLRFHNMLRSEQSRAAFVEMILTSRREEDGFVREKTVTGSS